MISLSWRGSVGRGGGSDHDYVQLFGIKLHQTRKQKVISVLILYQRQGKAENSQSKMTFFLPSVFCLSVLARTLFHKLVPFVLLIPPALSLVEPWVNDKSGALGPGGGVRLGPAADIPFSLAC